MKPKSKKNQQRLLQTDCHIGIVGSGLGGLSAALAILRCGMDYGAKQQKRRSNKNKSGQKESTNIEREKEQEANSSPSSKFQGRITIYERDLHATDRKEGYGMTLTFNPQGPLAQLDVLESIAQKDCPSRSHYLFNEKGEVMGYYGNAFHHVKSVENGDGGADQTVLACRGAGQRGNLRIPRAELRSIFMEKIKETDEHNDFPKVRIEWGKRLLSYVDRPAVEKLNQVHNQPSNSDSESKVESDGTSTAAAQRPVLLQFEDGTTDEVDLLIGADGVNSVVAKQYLSTQVSSKSKQPASTNDVSPQYLGIFIVIGISDHFHPLIDERGYYTLDGHHRLFIMPFEGSRLEPQSRRTMWQLSYPVVGKDEAHRLSKLDPADLQREVLIRCGSWHEPFPDMLKETPLATIWGTGLLDRDPQLFIQHRQALEVHGRIPSHVVVVGDAAHAMSPFKGSGANQALTDGPYLAKWLSQSKFDSAVRSYMAEMARRSGVKVRASREAALKLHSKNCWDWMASQDGVKSAIFHGVDSACVESFLDTLRKRSIGASLGSSLDSAISEVINEMNVSDSGINKGTSKSELSIEELSSLQKEALEHSSNGNLRQLRLLSQKSHSIIPRAIDSTHKTCLHFAASGGHLNVCRWLLSETNVDPTLLDEDNRTALELAVEKGHGTIVQFIKSWMDRVLSHNRSDVSSSALTDDVQHSEDEDMYRVVEQQLRPIRTMQQLGTLLRSNRNGTANTHTITHVLGYTITSSDHEEHRVRAEVLARQHGAVVLRNFISQELDQLAIGALALRPLGLDVSAIGDSLLHDTEKKKSCKQIEDIKSQLAIPAHSSVIAQTNFGPQLLAQTGNVSKRRKIESFPFSKLRYLNLGEWNYNWGERRYDRIPQAHRFPKELTKLAHNAYVRAQQSISGSSIPLKSKCLVPSFDMAICNFYHLQRSSDRLGGHKDDVESDLTSPLVTISLGAPGIFLLGGESRKDVPTAILLRAGDCMVMSGKSRLYYHGVPTILDYDSDAESHEPTYQTFHEDESNILYPELKSYLVSGCHGPTGCGNSTSIPSYHEMKFVKAFLRTARMNISIRQI